jgi:hypothetical protein
VITKDHFTEPEASRISPDTERVEGSQFAAEHSWHFGWSFASGLLRREAGAMVRPASWASSRHVGNTRGVRQLVPSRTWWRSIPCAGMSKVKSALYAIVVNDEHHFSVWPTQRRLPPGWRYVVDPAKFIPRPSRTSATSA